MGGPAAAPMFQAASHLAAEHSCCPCAPHFTTPGSLESPLLSPLPSNPALHVVPRALQPHPPCCPPALQPHTALQGIPAAMATSLYYYVGLAYMYNEQLEEAEGALRHAFRLCHNDYGDNRRAILRALIPVRQLGPVGRCLFSSGLGEAKAGLAVCPLNAPDKMMWVLHPCRCGMGSDQPPGQGCCTQGCTGAVGCFQSNLHYHGQAADCRRHPRTRHRLLGSRTSTQR
jgi:hypothetical protein